MSAICDQIFSRSSPLATRCTDDPTYMDNGWTCSNWALATSALGVTCREGNAPVNTPARTARLMASCAVEIERRTWQAFEQKIAAESSRNSGLELLL